jgi:hypothetical protein
LSPYLLVKTLILSGLPLQHSDILVISIYSMYIVPIAWLYVALMMAVAEATNTTGTLLGGIITFLLYGLGPVALVVYLMGAPARRKAIKAKEKAEFERQRSLAANQHPAATNNQPSSCPPVKDGSISKLADDRAAPVEEER